MADIVLASLVLGPVVITYFLKSNAALGFLALCVGFVLSTSVIGDLKHLLSETNLSVTNDTLAVVLVLGPYLITLLLARKAAHKGVASFLQLLAALAGGGLLALTVGPLLNSSNVNVYDSSFWEQLQNYQAAIIGIGALVSLIPVWSGGFRHSKKH